jgi:hypothetical protein
VEYPGVLISKLSAQHHSHWETKTIERIGQNSRSVRSESCERRMCNAIEEDEFVDLDSKTLLDFSLEFD